MSPKTPSEAIADGFRLKAVPNSGTTFPGNFPHWTVQNMSPGGLPVSQPKDGTNIVTIVFNGPGQYLVKAKTLNSEKTFTVYVIKVDIKMNGNVISDTTTDVIVGEAIDLESEVKPTGLAFESKQCRIPGVRVKDWVASLSSATLISVQPPDLQASTIKYYWVDGGDGRVVEYEVIVGGIYCKSEVTFEVKSPASTVTVVTGSVAADSSRLHYGNTAIPGISFSHTITVPAGFSGSTQWVQLVNLLRRRKLNNGTWQRWAAIGLDSSYPYDTSISTVDVPGTLLLSIYLEKTVNESFEMYLMFKPSGTDTIWVPLKRTGWSWSGSASRNGSVWTLDSSSNPAPTTSDTTSHPVWTRNVSGQNPEWVDE
ncbi:MAG: hypothetical protein GKR87_13175 [Kiritimatiellae bacterium]|nr:hypothetical protein [Kiritimatiellia bacterium]NKB25301.1 hypothetical protein [Kiritimatiellia bacterium]